MTDPDHPTLRAWIADDPDPETRTELAALLDARDRGAVAASSDPLTDPLTDPPLRFGTSGLRGPLGPGPARVNRVTARRVAVALVDLLGAGPTVVVGGDGRHGSAAMAADVAAVVAGRGGRALLAEAPTPTPLLAYAVRRTGADAGVVVTASHNPASDNGLKVYDRSGIQAVPPVDDTLAAGLLRALPDEARGALGTPGARPPGVEALASDVADAYVEVAASLVGPGPRALTVVHTALHGVSGPLATRVLDRIGVSRVVTVPAQARPDPDFPTLASPNPEDPAALAQAVALATSTGADLVLAHDPDGDRLAVAIPAPPGADPATPGVIGGWQVLSGNQLGALLCDHLCESWRASPEGSGPTPGVVASTLVSTGLIGAIAAHHGARHVVTPTGFKWVMQASLDPGTRFVFGFEEALGYAVTDAVGDKDGITAAAVVVDLVARLGPGGVWHRLDALAERHGVFESQMVAHPLPGADGRRRTAEVMSALRAHPPASLGGDPVVAVVDHGGDAHPVDLVTLRLRSGGVVHVRPSGTEPKLKVYAETVGRGSLGDARREARQHLAAVITDIAGRVEADPGIRGGSGGDR